MDHSDVFSKKITTYVYMTEIRDAYGTLELKTQEIKKPLKLWLLKMMEMLFYTIKMMEVHFGRLKQAVQEKD